MSEDEKPEAAEEAPVEAKKKAKPKKAKSKKSKPEAGAAGRTTLAISISAHPRAQRSIRRIRARTAIVAFAIVLILSHRSGVPNQEAVVRALLAGLAGNLAGWACAMGVWRQLIMGELRIVEDVRRDRRRARAEAAAAAAAERAERSASASAS
jgi:hypothetical protein